jgi:hypothetical protein
MPEISELDQIVKDILADMPLRDKAAIANLDERDVKYLQYAFDVRETGQLGKDHEEGKDAMYRIWKLVSVHRAPHLLCCRALEV